ncbi:MAG: TetR/AcrR family transcriptional regulator [Sphingomonadales bacterium]|nr:MAG: TetR/AcrR family transcriptional regulator [Sphingomonadales bacterium]
MEQGATTEPISGHSRGKLKRQRAILDAAREIMAQTGEAGLTMFALATRAGVSPATPYNLFGSKQAILQAVYEEDMREFHAGFDERASSDPLARIFDLGDLSIEHWSNSPDFYKALLMVLSRNGGPGVDGAWSPGRSYARQLIKDLAASGGLVAKAPLAALSTALVRTLKSVGQEWVDGELTLEQAGRDVGIAFGVVLTGFVTPQTKAALADILDRYGASDDRS